ncbi:uncharacterized protein DFL_008880 [Arthrobotrys flagrans]|uniref:Uncharacterized protein n=1 Tax=Arthrobotrys flagrans TaxID=97331 RepID=A0A436ZQ17_ARTFL|nr:hypothetical protein DFL_008880 [Arthrobotrys flagrans]
MDEMTKRQLEDRIEELVVKKARHDLESEKKEKDASKELLPHKPRKDDRSTVIKLVVPKAPKAATPVTPPAPYPLATGSHSTPADSVSAHFSRARTYSRGNTRDE